MSPLNAPDYFDELKEQLYSAVISDVLDSLGTETKRWNLICGR